MLVAIYCRASRIHRHRDGVTLEQQEADCRAHALAQGWTVVEVYTDASKTAYRDDLSKRDAFQRMLADARRKKFEAVLVYKLDRFARKPLIAYQAAADLERCGVMVVSATERFDRATVSGRLTFGILAVVAEAQSGMHGERMAAIRLTEAQHGRLTGPIPVGLERVDGVTRPSRHAEMIVEVFQLYSSGQHSFQAIVKRLRSTGWAMPDGRPLAVFDIKRILHSKAYIGIVTCDGREFPAAFPAIISPDLWERAQAQLTRRRPDRDTRGYTCTADEEALLAGLGTCANCGAKLHYQHDRRRDYRYYYCSGRRDGSYCNAPYNYAERLEEQLIEVVRTIGTLPHAWYVAALDAFAHQQRSVKPPVDRTQIEERLRRLARAYGDGAYTQEEYEERQRSLLELLKTTEEARPHLDIDQFEEALRTFTDHVHLLEPLEQRSIIQRLFTQVYARRNEIYALRATRLFAPLLVQLSENTRSAYLPTYSSTVRIPLILA